MSGVIEAVISNGGFSASSVPSAYMYKTDATYTAAQTTTISTLLTPVLSVVTTTAGRLNMMTMPSAGKLKSTSTRSFYASVTGQISGASAGSFQRFGHQVAKNGTVVNADEYCQVGNAAYSATGGLQGNPISSDVLIAFDDEITVMTQSIVAGTQDWSTHGFNLRIDFKGWA
jgi:hypothetical protein